MFAVALAEHIFMIGTKAFKEVDDLPDLSLDETSN